MFTLCMSRAHSTLATDHPNNKNHFPQKPVKGGYLLRYRKKFFCNTWSKEWVVLYEDSTLAFFTDKGLGRGRGQVRIGDAPDRLAVGEWTRKVPRPPHLPHSCLRKQLIVVGARCTHEVHWLMAQSPAEVSEWMTAISNTLPPPPQLPPEYKLCTRTTPSVRANPPSVYHISDGRTTPKTLEERRRRHDDEHTVLPGVALDWGRGLGWGQGTWIAAQLATCSHDTSHMPATHLCHPVEDYGVGGCEEMDWSAIGDFCF